MAYTADEVAKLLGLPVGRVRAYARDGLIPAARGRRGEYRFAFRDVVVARIAKDLAAARVPRRRIRRAVAALSGRTLSALRIGAESGDVVVEDEQARWAPGSRQLHFRLREFDREVVHASGISADEWYELGCDLEPSAVGEAEKAYRRALEIDPGHAEAHVNLGWVLHERGDLPGAERHYRAALPDATAAFNLGVVLEDSGRDREALEAYERAIEADPTNADAHFNAAGVCERLGEQQAALGHLNRYRYLTKRA